MRIRFSSDFPPELKPSTSELLAHQRCLPVWVAEVYVGFSNSDGDNASTVTAEPEYRRVVLGLTAGFFKDDPDERARTILHEFAHAQLAPLVNWVEALIKLAAKDDVSLVEHFTEELRLAHEAVTQDISESWLQLHDGGRLA